MKDFDKSNCFIVEGKLALPYTYFAGATGSRFITTLRDQKKITGVKCSKCNKVYIPPRGNCDICMEDISKNWVDIKNTGTVTNYTVVRYKDKHLPKNPPYILALIKLDGADTSVAHIVEGIDPEKVKIGMKVQAVFAKEQRNTLREIDHFEPA
ncbi:MAG: Zn-ribbon domain-containing OB-fold protein [Spirochaetes bacterium]|nr:Zn-ribbon domain-containing OB-fold protein [Spirochaetota bacterium]